MRCQGPAWSVSKEDGSRERGASQAVATVGQLDSEGWMLSSSSSSSSSSSCCCCSCSSCSYTFSTLAIVLRQGYGQ